MLPLLLNKYEHRDLSSSSSPESSKANTETLICTYWDDLDWSDNLCVFTLESPRNPLENLYFENVLATALWHACRRQTLGEVRALCEAGAHINSQAETLLRSTPLMVACTRTRKGLDIVKYLVESCGADVNRRDKNNENCLFYAVRAVTMARDPFELVKYLIERGVETNVLNKNARSVIEFAVHVDDNGRVLQMLLNAQPAFDINSVHNALIYAAYEIQCKYQLNYYYLKYNLIRELILNVILFIHFNIAYKFGIDRNRKESKFRMLLEYAALERQIKVYAFELIALNMLEWYNNDRRLCVFTFAIMIFRESMEQASNERAHIEVRSDGDVFNSCRELSTTIADPLSLKALSLCIRERLLVAYPHKLIELATFRLYYLSDSARLFQRLTKNNSTPSTQLQFQRIANLWQHALAVQLIYCKPVEMTILKNINAYYSFLMHIYSNKSLLASITACTNSDSSNDAYSKSLFGLFKMCMHELYRMLALDGSELAPHPATHDSIANIIRCFEAINYSELFETIVQTDITDNQQQKQVWHKYYPDKDRTKIKDYFISMTKQAVCVISHLVTYNTKRVTTTKMKWDKSNEIRSLTKLLIRLTISMNTSWHVLCLATLTNIRRDLVGFIDESLEWSITEEEEEENVRFERTIAVNPSYEFVNYLLECGADPNAVLTDSKRNTFLNSIMFESIFFDDRVECDRFIKLFVRYGAHFDYVNDSGESLANKYFAKFGQSVYLLFPNENHISLKCLASRLVYQHRDKLCKNYKELPTDLVVFVERH